MWRRRNQLPREKTKDKKLVCVLFGLEREREKEEERQEYDFI